MAASCAAPSCNRAMPARRWRCDKLRELRELRDEGLPLNWRHERLLKEDF
jgi:hypothetical protein